MSLASSKLDSLAGRRIRLSGGYDMEPAWLGGASECIGMLRGFIPGQNTAPAAVVDLDAPITAEGITASVAVLELRYVGAHWGEREVVHIELCDFEPESKPWAQRRQGKWVESHATFQLLS